MATTIRKVKLDAAAALSETVAKAVKSADDRFAHADKVLANKPNGLAPDRQTPEPSGEDVAKPNQPPALTSKVVVPFDPSNVVIGSIVSAPLGLIDLNPVSPRQHYDDNIVDKISATIPDGQDDAAHGFVKDGRIKLIDGGTRYRSCVVTGQTHLDVKIEEEPKDSLSLYLRARALNENRSDATALDFALSLEKLFSLGAVNSLADVAAQIPGPKGGAMTEKTASCYLRIARQLSPRLQARMASSEYTAKYNALYEVSGLFVDGMDEQQLEARTALADSIIDEIISKKLSKNQIEALVKSRLAEKKTRTRSQVHPLKFATYTGQIKVFEKKGKIDLSLAGIAEDKLAALADKLEETVKAFLA